jgi:hypothetical protein
MQRIVTPFCARSDSSMEMATRRKSGPTVRRSVMTTATTSWHTRLYATIFVAGQNRLVTAFPVTSEQVTSFPVTSEQATGFPVTSEQATASPALSLANDVGLSGLVTLVFHLQIFSEFDWCPLQHKLR